MTGGSSLIRPVLQHTKIQKVEKDIQSLVDLMENSWINPLRSDDADLVSLSTGTLAPSEETYHTFKISRLETYPPTVKFPDKMTNKT